MVNFPDIHNWRNLHGDILADYEACLAAIVPPPPVICDAGYHAENGQCIPDPFTPQITCPEGYHAENSQCVKDVVITPTCGTGYHLENGQCVKDTLITPFCGTGYHLQNNECIKDTTLPLNCNAGYHLENGNCVPDSIPARCEDVIANSHLDEVLQDCVCNNGYHAENGKCIKTTIDITCPTGYKLNQASDGCELITIDEHGNEQKLTAGLSIKPIYILIGVAIIGYLMFKIK